jgi:hypothetical protein
MKVMIEVDDPEALQYKLYDEGFKYEVDFELFFFRSWEVKGVVCMNYHCAKRAMELLK